jgi:hypothetical protein
VDEEDTQLQHFKVQYPTENLSELNYINADVTWYNTLQDKMPGLGICEQQHHFKPFENTNLVLNSVKFSHFQAG